MAEDKVYKKSRTFSMSDEDWKQIEKAAKTMGLQKRKGMAISRLAQAYNEAVEYNDAPDKASD